MDTAPASERKPLDGLHELATRTITYNTTVLGRGSYAAVYKAKCEELPCAVKILHNIFQEDPDVNTLAEGFNRECEYLKNIRHPNIVQYLGLCRDPQTHHPALLMELLDQSLTQFLESSTERLDPRIEVSICHDTALALAHLHSIGIVHRDLSSNNVLLIGAGTRAKVCDFGMSKVIDARYSRRSSTPMLHSMCPGTVAYMPPEALVELPGYTEKLDCFSFGVLSIQIMTRLFPNPTARTKMIESTLSLTGMVTVPVLETECRKDHIDMIDPLHPLLAIALRCLELKKEERPSARELCEQVEEVGRNVIDETLPLTPERDESVRSTHNTIPNQLLIQNKNEEIADLQQQLMGKQTENDRLTERTVTLEVEKQHFEEELTQINRDREDTASRLQGELKQTLLESSSLKARCDELEMMHREQEGKISRLQGELEESLSANYILSEKYAEQSQEIANILQTSMGEQKRNPKEDPESANLLEHNDEAVEPEDHQTTFQVSNHLPVSDWVVGTPSPYNIAQFTSAVHGNRIFCGFFDKTWLVFFFDVKLNNWTPIRSFCNNTFLRLSLFTKQVSGILYALKDNEICHYEENGWFRDGILKNSIISRVTFITYNQYIISLHKPNSLMVSLFTGEAFCSHHLADSPPFQHASTSIVNQYLYLVGAQIGENIWTNKVFCMKLEDIFDVKNKKSLRTLFKLGEYSSIECKEIAPLPVVRSASVTYREQLSSASYKEHLLAVGGYIRATGEASRLIYLYKKPLNMWEVIGYIPTGRYSCAAHVVGNKLVVIGGWVNQFTKCNIVEVGTIKIT